MDTNIISFLLRGRPEVRAHDNAIKRAADMRFILSPVVDYEFRRYLLLKGATRNLAQYETLIVDWEKPLFDAAHWANSATLWAERHALGCPIADADLLIAVTAIQQNAVLVTHNTSLLRVGAASARLESAMTTFLRPWAESDKAAALAASRLAAGPRGRFVPV